MNTFCIGLQAKLDPGVLEEYHSKMEDGDVLNIDRYGRGIDMQKEGIMLRSAGFIHIVEKRKKPARGTYTISAVRAPKQDMLLSVIVPLYNEENTAGILLEKLIDRKWTMPVEFILVESNSKDKTRDIARSYENRPNVTLVLEDEPHGKGNAVLNGIEHANGNIIAIQDGDLEYDVEDYDKLLQPIIDRKTLFVLGSRYRKDNWHMRKFSGVGNMIADYLNIGQVILTWALNTACGCRLTDPFTMYKIFDRDCMYGINFTGGNFGLDWELVIRFVRKGYVPVELPISYKARSFEEGKHIALFATPIEGLKALVRSRFIADVYDYGDE